MGLRRNFLLRANKFLAPALAGIVGLSAVKSEALEQRAIHSPRQITQVQRTAQMTAPLAKIDPTGYNANAKNQCSGYARRIAEQHFGLKYALSPSAWTLAKANRVISRSNFERKTQTGGYTQGQLENLHKGGLLREGIIIGAYNPRSAFNSPDKKYTHAVVFAGKNSHGEMIFYENAGGPKARTLPEVLARYKLVEIIAPKSIAKQNNLFAQN